MTHAWPRYKVLYLAYRGKWKLHGIYETRRDADMEARSIEKDGYRTYVVQEGQVKRNPTYKVKVDAHKYNSRTGKTITKRFTKSIRASNVEAAEIQMADRMPGFSGSFRAKENDLSRAKRLYKSFTGKSAPEPRKINVPSFTKTGVVFGTLFGVGYISERDGKPYQHTFRAKSRPLLIASSDGKSVLIVGGRFAFTERGIVDK